MNTASIGGLVTTSANAAYTVSKHAVVALSECLSKELAARGDLRLGVSVLCPGWVATGIAYSDRNHPDQGGAELADPDRRERLRAVVSKGMDPRAVGALVLEAVQADRFYIKTHPLWDTLIKNRFEAILDGGKPAVTPLPRD